MGMGEVQLRGNVMQGDGLILAMAWRARFYLGKGGFRHQVRLRCWRRLNAGGSYLVESMDSTVLPHSGFGGRVLGGRVA